MRSTERVIVGFNTPLMQHCNTDYEFNYTARGVSLHYPWCLLTLTLSLPWRLIGVSLRHLHPVLTLDSVV